MKRMKIMLSFAVTLCALAFSIPARAAIMPGQSISDMHPFLLDAGVNRNHALGVLVADADTGTVTSADNTAQTVWNNTSSVAAFFFNYDNTYPGSSGDVLAVTGILVK